MKLSLNTNIGSLTAQNQLLKASEKLQTSFERLSSGLRINRAGDDPAGLALANSLQSDARLAAQAMRNVNDGVSLLNIAESALKELSSIVTRQVELATQASTGTLSLKQRRVLDREVNGLVSEYNRIIDTVEFNGIKLFDGGDTSVTLQAGVGNDGIIAFDLGGQLAQTVGDGTFTSGTSFSPANLGFSIISADFDNDGNNDLLASIYSPNVALMLGNGNGTFKAAQVFSTASCSFGISTGDLDNDGFLDLLVPRSGAGHSAVDVLLGNGDGTFSAAISYATGGEPFDGKLADVNNDGSLDIVTADYTGGTMSVLLNNGNGTFLNSLTFDVGTTARGVSLGDFNHDGNIDAVVSVYWESALKLMIGHGNGTFTASKSVVLVEVPSSNTVTDLNNDGELDIIAPSHWLNYVDVLLGNGNGTFAAALSYGVGSRPRRVSAVDLTGDGIFDLVASNSNDASISVLVGNGNGTFQAQSQFSVGLNPSSHAINDFNSDGVPDIASSDDSSDTISLLIADTTESVRLPYVDITEQGLAQSAVGIFREALERIGQEQGAIGAVQSRLQSVLSHLGGLADNYQAAASKIQDVDVAEEAAALVRYKVIEQVGTAILAQANQTVSIVKKLLDF